MTRSSFCLDVCSNHSRASLLPCSPKGINLSFTKRPNPPLTPQATTQPLVWSGNFFRLRLHIERCTLLIDEKAVQNFFLFGYAKRCTDQDAQRNDLHLHLAFLARPRSESRQQLISISFNSSTTTAGSQSSQEFQIPFGRPFPPLQGGDQSSQPFWIFKQAGGIRENVFRMGEASL